MIEMISVVTLNLVPIITTTTFLVRRRMKVDTIELKSFGTYSLNLNSTILYLCEKYIICPRRIHIKESYFQS